MADAFIGRFSKALYKFMSFIASCVAIRFHIFLAVQLYCFQACLFWSSSVPLLMRFLCQAEYDIKVESLRYPLF